MADQSSIIHTQDVPPTAWRNGAGVTREIALHRTPGAVSDVDWRISLADLTRDAPFSLFPGRDRTFVVVSRAGVVLEVDGVAKPLDQGDSLSFPGQAAAKVSLPSGPATALNLMTSRAWSGSARVFAVDGEQILTPHTVAVLLLEGSASTSLGRALEPMEFLLCGTDVETMHFTEARAAVIEVRRR